MILWFYSRLKDQRFKGHQSLVMFLCACRIGLNLLIRHNEEQTLQRERKRGDLALKTDGEQEGKLVKIQEMQSKPK